MHVRALQALLVAVSLSGPPSAAHAAAAEQIVDTQQSTVTVRVFKSGLFRAFADDHVVQAPLMEGSIDNPATTPHVQIVIDPRQMRVLDPGLSARDREQVQTRMLGPEVLDVDRFQRISFHSVAVERRDAGGWVVRGELELHGQTHPVVLRAALENGRYKGSVALRQSDFGIVPISIAGGTVKVKDEIRVEFDLVTAGRLASAGPGRVETAARAQSATPRDVSSR